MYGSLMRDILPLLQQEMQREPISDESPLRAIEDRLVLLRDYLSSNEYPCPICVSRGLLRTHPEEVGTVTLEWDHECDDMGYKVSSWPVFVSTCQDEERTPYTRRGSVRPTGMGYYRTPEYPRNHGEQLNRMIEDDGSSEAVNYILGSAQERRRLRDLLGIGEPDNNWR